uniref:Phosphatidylinositol-specific phospholipase C X domain-containing protein n=1 Tax=Echeneis naucrates TaxID=173247 RepID=A0A665W7I4_ECHNA
LSPFHVSLSTRTTSCLGSTNVFNDKRELQSKFFNEDWMMSIPDTTPLSAITIPGTHESLSLYGGPLVCQVWTLENQLSVGLRFFDIHAGIWIWTQKYLYIRDRYWMFSQGKKVDEVLECIAKFLEVHKSETVLMMVTLHGLYKDTAKELWATLVDTYKNIMLTSNSVPNMEQARGKIVLLQSHNGPSGGAQVQSSPFFKNNELISHKVDTMELRLDVCKSHFVLTDMETKRFRIKSQKNLARRVNQQIYNVVLQSKKSSASQGCLGVFGMIFPGAELIKNQHLKQHLDQH